MHSSGSLSLGHRFPNVSGSWIPHTIYTYIGSSYVTIFNIIHVCIYIKIYIYIYHNLRKCGTQASAIVLRWLLQLGRFPGWKSRTLQDENDLQALCDFQKESCFIWSCVFCELGRVILLWLPSLSRSFQPISDRYHKWLTPIKALFSTNFVSLWTYIILLPGSLNFLLVPLLFTLLPLVCTQHSHSIAWKLQSSLNPGQRRKKSDTHHSHSIVWKLQLILTNASVRNITLWESQGSHHTAYGNYRNT